MINKTIGCRINQLLAEKDVKQKDLARKLGVTDNTVSYFVSGARKPNIEQIIKIAKYFNVSTDYILGVSNAKTADVDVKAVCEYTGLSAEAVNNLPKYHERDIIILDTLIRNYFFEDFLKILSELYAKTILSDSLENLYTDHICKLFNISIDEYNNYYSKDNYFYSRIKKVVAHKIGQKNKEVMQIYNRIDIEYNNYQIAKELEHLKKTSLDRLYDLIWDVLFSDSDEYMDFFPDMSIDIQAVKKFISEKEGESHGNNPEERK